MSDADSNIREKCRTAATDAVSRVRDRRRKERQRLEEMFGRKTVVSVGFMGGASKVVETAIIPLLSRNPFHADVAAAWVLWTVTTLGAAVYWRELSEKASEAADSVEDAVDGDG